MESIKVKMTLNSGKNINLELYPDVAPVTVENFVGLVRGGFYNGLCFHRVIDNFMVQAGGFVAEGKTLIHKEPPKEIVGEFAANGFKNDLSHIPGVVSMARTNKPNSASSQFFICTADCRFLDGQYAAFGRISDEESLQNAIDIGKVSTHSYMYFDDIPDSPIVITSMTIVE